MEDWEYNEEQYKLFEKAWEILPMKDRVLIVMRKIHDLDDKAILEKLKVELRKNDNANENPRLITTRVYQAMERLREIINDLRNNENM